MICGTLLTGDATIPHDSQGYILKSGHHEPHKFVADNGATYEWETDLACGCGHCMRADGDYCTLYWVADHGDSQPTTKESK